MARSAPLRRQALSGRKAPRPQPAAAHSKRAARSAERRDAILAAALDEFASQGFAAARLDDVARRAKVAKGTIYLHFKDKEALFQELVRSVLSPVVGTVEATLGSDLPTRVIAEQAIELFIREVYGTRRKDVIRLIITEGGRFPKLAEFYYREVLSRMLGVVRKLAQRAFERGELRADAPVRFPQLVGAPVMVAIVWNGLFGRFEPLDIRTFLLAHLDLLFRDKAAP
jgi:AcrR family transcriptional regulator